MWQKRESIHAALKEKRYDEVRDGVCQYENMLTEEQSLHWQRCLAWRVQLEEACGVAGKKLFVLRLRHWHIQ